MELKAKKIDDDSAKWKAKLAADEKEAESLDRYRKELAAIGRAKVNQKGQGSIKTYTNTYDNRGRLTNREITETPYNGNK